MKVMLSYISHFVSGLLVLAVCLFSGCQKSATQKVTDDLGNDYISFSGGTSDGYAVKSSDDGSTPELATTDILKTKPFGVFGGKSYDGATNFSPVFQTDKAQLVEWKEEGTTRKWTYDPKRKWERAMHYRFRAVWPYKPENIQTGSSANCLSVTYSSFTEDYDLMVAYATRWPLQDEDGVGPVTLSFKHALAGLRFKIKFAEDITESDNLTEFYITGIYPHGQLFYGFGLDASVTKEGEGGTETGTPKKDDGLIVWKCGDNAFNSTTPQFHWLSTQPDEEPKPFGGESRAAANVYFTENTAGTTGGKFVDGAALIVPQILSSKPGMETYVNFYTVNGGSALHKAKLPENTELKPGKIYTFTLTINGPQITIKVDIQDWKAINSNIDIIL